MGSLYQRKELAKKIGLLAC